MSLANHLDMDNVLRGVPAPANLPASHTINPYWDIVRTIPGNRLDWEFYGTWSPDWITTMFSDNRIERYELCTRYTYAIPDPASLEFVKEQVGSHAVEMGAGMGYWAWQLSQLGVDLLCYDAAPPDRGKNTYHNREGKPGIATWHPIQAGTPDLLTGHADRTLFLCWPPMSRMAWKAVNAYEGKRLVYIGEGDGGCTADEAFFKRLTRKWELIATHRPVQWNGIHDVIEVYERK